MKFTITIEFDGKETKAQRAIRIAETNNGRTTRTRTVPDKKRKKLEKARRMAEEA